ncbi:cyclic nucleotide-binding/CBS domain-containing protein [Cupriavidus sp. IK-TO18]|uniref:CBS domain-containing protein n=1 Tax=Cupriavidus sp. IK-TO18 TaxID=2782182 RepID=UPI0018997876|nr:CBS domain-containing protein [Cupriavidus sp. IK-TO18]MBF6990001.1 CBS domain-containing protein [Cupriavidus sp. IK-TO18]
MRVQDICSAKAVHVPLSCTLQEAAVQMRDRHVGALIVTENSPSGTRAIGMVTDRDMVIDATASGADPCRTEVIDVMTRGLVAISRDAAVAEAIELMLSHGVRRLAVLDGEAVSGVISLDDLLGALAADWGMIASLIRKEQQRECSDSIQSALHA